MTRLMQLRVVIAVVGVIVWGYGVATDHSTIRLVGIGILVVSLVLRFARKRQVPPNDGNTTM